MQGSELGVRGGGGRGVVVMFERGEWTGWKRKEEEDQVQE